MSEGAASALIAGPVFTVAEVIQRLHDIKGAVTTPDGPRSGIYWFSHLYLVITENVQQKINEGQFFADNEYLTALDVAFANRYLDAVRTHTQGETAPDVWQLLFDVPADGEILPVQLAMAGVNAHINFDLAFAVVNACHALDRKDIDWGEQKADYDKVNDIFAEEMDRLLRELARGYSTRREMERLSLLERMATQIVVLARGAAWENAGYLWPLEPTTARWRQREGAMDDAAAALSRAMLIDLPG
ncbi:MAG TPA: DUF5995 family protein [Acidimicrobiia bacterium]|jgi:hypothetical protein